MFVMSSGIGALRVRRSGVITLQDLTGDFLSAAITLTRRLSPDIFASMKIYKGALR